MTAEDITAQAARIRVFLATRYYYGDISAKEYLIAVHELNEWITATQQHITEGQTK